VGFSANLKSRNLVEVLSLIISSVSGENKERHRKAGGKVTGNREVVRKVVPY
jgi:hypothetical protein